MAIRDAFKISRKTFINPRGWLSYDLLKDQTAVMWAIIKAIFTPTKPTRTETFEEAVKRLELTEQDIASGITSYRYYAIGLFVLAFFALAYAFFLLFYYKTFTGWFLGIAVTGLLASQAFRYDFWAFQMRRRKLGATFNEWKDAFLGKKEPSE